MYFINRYRHCNDWLCFDFSRLFIAFQIKKITTIIQLLFYTFDNMKTVKLTSRNCSNISLFGVSWFKAYINRDGCLPKPLYCYLSNINAN